MICSIHQPNYIPYLGLFHKIAQSDIFVFYDTAQYTKGDYHNRNTIKGPNGPILLSLPVQVSLGQTIETVKFDTKVLSKHLKSIQESYRKATYFQEVYPVFEELLSQDDDSLSFLNRRIITKLVELLEIQVQLYTLSEILPELHTKSTDALIEITKLLHADTYLSGSGGKGYLEPEKFQNHQISLIYQDFHHPIYPQLWGDFLPYMSIVDALMNIGPSGAKKLLFEK